MSVRSYGLACDQLTALSMVDYQGNLIQASSTQNQDLLWASCGGGGGNLGIVTSFTLKTNSLATVPYVTTAVISWSGYDSAAQAFDKVIHYIILQLFLEIRSSCRLTSKFHVCLCMFFGSQHLERQRGHHLPHEAKAHSSTAILHLTDFRVAFCLLSTFMCCVVMSALGQARYDPDQCILLCPWSNKSHDCIDSAYSYTLEFAITN